MHSRMLIGSVVVILVAISAPFCARASISDDINAKQQQIEALQRQIDAYQLQAETAGKQSRTLQNEIAKLNAQIGQITTQIKQLNASIDQTDLEIQQTTDTIADAERKLELHQRALAEYVRLTDQTDQQNLAQILLQNNSLSDFFDYVHHVQMTQDNLQLAIRSIRELHSELDERRDVLENQQSDLERLKGLTQIQQRSLTTTKSTKNTLLQQTKGQETRFQQLVKQSTLDLQRLREQVQYLLQGGLTIEDAVTYAKLAAIGAGIRPAFLLALLEVESRLGQNVGTGNWKDDMYLCYQRLANYYPSKRQYYMNRAETEKSAYFKIMASLGLDPDSQKVSREPTYGCGGAMGPAQFIPSTWTAYIGDIVRITGHNPPSPWNFQDAFTASALKLARGGATSRERIGEIRAAKAYISGNPSCTSTTCNSYANTIIQKAAEIEKNL